jgi:NADH-quinone oxidoreductase subunit J
MMLNLNRIGSLERSTLVLRSVGAIVAGLLLVIIAYAVRSVPVTSGDSIGMNSTMGTAREIGLSLFDRWMLPFQVVGLMLLAAVVGVVALTKRETKINKNRQVSGAEQ